MLFLIIFAGIAVFAEVTSIELDGKCDGLNVPSEPNFDETKYLGTWYEVGNTFVITKDGITCTRYTMTLLPDGRLNMITESKDSDGAARPMLQSALDFRNESDKARMRGFTDLGLTDFPENPEGDYVVVHTDYSCALIYCCLPLQLEDIEDTDMEGFLILSRSSEPSAEQLSSCKAVLNNLAGEPDVMDVKQTDCYAPEASA